MPKRSWKPVIKIFAYHNTNSQSTPHKFPQTTLALGKTYSPSIYRVNQKFKAPLNQSSHKTIAFSYEE